MWTDESFNAKAFDYYPNLKKLRLYFESNYSEQICLSDAANIVGLETKYFGKFFRRTVGIGFKRWTTGVRIRMAMNAIGTEHQQLVDIAFAVGFQDFSTFQRAFKRHTGTTPRDYRRTIICQLKQQHNTARNSP
jgi:two-component system, response regulator YesN